MVSCSLRFFGSSRPSANLKLKASISEHLKFCCLEELLAFGFWHASPLLHTAFFNPAGHGCWEWCTHWRGRGRSCSFPTSPVPKESESLGVLAGQVCHLQLVADMQPRPIHGTDHGLLLWVGECRQRGLDWPCSRPSGGKEEEANAPQRPWGVFGGGASSTPLPGRQAAGSAVSEQGLGWSVEWRDGEFNSDSRRLLAPGWATVKPFQNDCRKYSATRRRSEMAIDGSVFNSSMEFCSPPPWRFSRVPRQELARATGCVSMLPRPLVGSTVAKASAHFGRGCSTGLFPTSSWALACEPQAGLFEGRAITCCAEATCRWWCCRPIDKQHPTGCQCQKKLRAAWRPEFGPCPAKGAQGNQEEEVPARCLQAAASNRKLFIFFCGTEEKTGRPEKQSRAGGRMERFEWAVQAMVAEQIQNQFEHQEATSCRCEEICTRPSSSWCADSLGHWRWSISNQTWIVSGISGWFPWQSCWIGNFAKAGGRIWFQFGDRRVHRAGGKSSRAISHEKGTGFVLQAWARSGFGQWHDPTVQFGQRDHGDQAFATWMFCWASRALQVQARRRASSSPTIHETGSKQVMPVAILRWKSGCLCPMHTRQHVCTGFHGFTFDSHFWWSYEILWGRVSGAYYHSSTQGLASEA